jgi:hypothetical protein
VLGLDDSNDLARVARHIGGADPLAGMGDAEDLPLRGMVADDDVMHTFEGRLAGVNLDDDLVADHEDLGDDAAGSGGNQAAVLGDGGNFDDGEVQLAGLAVLGVEAVAKVLGKEGEVLVTHPDTPFVDACGDVLASLVRPAAVDHVEGGPAVFGFGPDGSADEKVELHLALEVVLLNVICQRNGYSLGVTGRGKARPAEVHSRLEELHRLFSRHNLVHKRLATYAVLQCAVLRHLVPPLCDGDYKQSL